MAAQDVQAALNRRQGGGSGGGGGTDRTTVPTPLITALLACCVAQLAIAGHGPRAGSRVHCAAWPDAGAAWGPAERLTSTLEEVQCPRLSSARTAAGAPPPLRPLPP